MTDRRSFIGLGALGLGGAALVGTALSSRAAAGTPRYAVPPMAIPSLPIDGSSKRFPVHRIYCMGLNYKSHVNESSFKAPGPFYFQKSNDMIVENGSTIAYPMLTGNFHYEIEMVVALARGGVNIPVEQALDCVYGYALGLDMTRRDLQMADLKGGLPWESGKSFEQCAPCTAIHPVEKVGQISKGAIELRVNGDVHQQDDISSLILDVPHIISFLSTSIALAPGDLIYTGTPAGVGPVVKGDRMVGKLESIGELTIAVG